jgi:protein ImuA
VKTVKLEVLREEVARLERGSSRVASERFSLGDESIDAALGGGLLRGGMHEIFAETSADEPNAAAFAVALAVRASAGKPVVWVRQDFVSVEAGELYAPGIAELGLSPDRLILVKARDGPAVLRAGEEAVRCSPLGAVIVEPWGAPKALDLAASRRLALVAGQSGVSLFMVRAGARPAPSAAATRWSVKPALSRALEADAPGHPSWTLSLMRDRAGISGRNWTVEWNRDDGLFTLPIRHAKTGEAIQGEDWPAVAGAVVSVPSGGPDHEERLAG